MEIYLRGVELAVRGAVAEEPKGRHALVGREDELTALLAHVDRRADCEALLVVAGSPVAIPAGVRERLHGRVLVADGRDAAALAAWLLPVPAIVLAAGAGTRMGGGKMLLLLGGRPLIGWAVEAALEGGADGTWLVYAEASVRAAAGDRVHAIHNPDAARGQASSLGVGLRALPGAAAAAIVLLGDQPLVGAATVRTLLGAWRAPGAAPAVAAAYGPASGGSGKPPWLPPVVLDRALWPMAQALGGDEGARAIFRHRPELVQPVAVEGRPEDADTAADLERIERLVLE